MDSSYVSAWIGALSAGLVALAVYLGQREQARITATLSLYSEFNTIEWMNRRQAAYDYLYRCPDPKLLQMRDMERPPLSKAEREVVWALLAFYARLAIMIEAKVVSPRLILPAFGEVFVYWWEFSFRHLRDATHASELEQIEQLHGWLSRRAVREAKVPSFSKWASEGERSRTRAFADLEAA